MPRIVACFSLPACVFYVIMMSVAVVSGKFSLGSGRKKEKTRTRSIPDVHARGGLVWNVQVSVSLWWCLSGKT